MCLNVSKASNSKESMRNLTEVESTSGLDNIKVITDEINKKCEDGLSDLSKNLERQTNDLRSSSTESMRNVSVVVANIKKDVEKSTSGLDVLKAVTDEVKTTCKDGLSDLSKRLAALEKQMKELDQATEKKTQTIAFNVADAVNYTGSDAIKFSNIILNKGDAYNKDTGIFTPPIDGIYQFNAHICGNKTVDDINYYIKINSKWIVTGEFTIPARATDAKCTSFSAVALVKKGENVRVGGMSFSQLDDYNDDYCSFSGVLIQSI
ncbi:heavy metal-binding protein HIP-like [Ruditapes philippinarum]|uniref:heavy metal-binding protein HIP-like n=1 Tax=Ruditapes philippinarum TaxID=129788 RepID=UPI00295BD6DD|nr:heavy metal-binding protein HIP-like [Ruditapes philippinarum]